ncbi:Site-specific DNA recombinase [Palleronia salina]|uniref:Site-specific DNA recombinase n=1 Tax=Palleronia salina TaxID=313368 RepID=A0A1M6B1I9_9RHOB|nr:recombinase family protein [Palleronia salina]SHI42602.1 Site-specific DNA recombinase [Palleronia salina]
MEKWGYVRVSVDRATQAAGWAEQHRVLKELGCTRIFEEEASTRGERPVFDAMMREAAQNANETKRICICAAKMDRAFRDLIAADAAITKGDNPHVIWHLPDLSPNPLDPSDPVQMLLVRMMAAVGQFERDRLAERRAYGIAKAKAEGKYKGRAPTARAKTDKVLSARSRGLTPDETAKVVGISRASVYRILKDHPAA